MIEAEHWNERQRGLIPEERAWRYGVNIIGVGAIGSYIALASAKLGLYTSAWDPDIVTPANIGAQLYGPAFLGLRKVNALRTLIGLLSANELQAIYTEPRTTLPFHRRISDNEIYVLAVDSMETRKQLVLHGARPSTLSRYPSEFNPLVIDVRAGWNTLIVATCFLRDKASVARYKATLYTDAQASAEPCQARSVTATNMVCAGLATSIIKQHVLGGPLPEYLSMDLGSFMAFGDLFTGVTAGAAPAPAPTLAEEDEAEGEAPAEDPTPVEPTVDELLAILETRAAETHSPSPLATQIANDWIRSNPF